MNVAVLLAGVADPKWPVDDAAARRNAGLDATPPAARLASPFDESALEVALQLRDADPGTALTVFAPGGAEVEPLLRQAAAHRPAAVARLEDAPGHGWDARHRARLLADALAALPAPPDLVLLGREFGDADDGCVPACLAETLGWPFLARVRQVRRDGGAFLLVREHGGAEERLARAGPLVASVTNDRANRLRHPLLKNVMAAKREPVAVQPAQGGARSATALSAAATRGQPRAGTGRVLEGSLEARVAAMAALLRAWQASR